MMDSRRVPGLQPMTRTARADDPGQQDPGGSRQPGWLEPELATLTADRLSDPAWLFERKFDGERCLAFRAGQQLRLMTRNRQQVTSTYPETADALRAQQASDFIARRRRCMPEKQRRRWREAMPSHHGFLMIAEAGLDRGDGGREPAGLAADDRCDRLGGIAAPLGPDADGVPSDVGRALPEGLGGAFQPSPGPADQAGDHSGGRLPGQAGRATPPV